MKKYIKFLLVVFLVINFVGGVNIFTVQGFSEEKINLLSEYFVLDNGIDKNINSGLFTLAQNEEEKKDQSREEENSSNSYPVTLDGETLFDFAKPIANISPQIRAEKTNEAIKKLADDYTLEPGSIKITKLSEQLILLSTNNMVVATLSKDDAQLANLSLSQLAEAYQEKIIVAIEEYRDERDITKILIRSLVAVVISALFVVFIKLIRFIHLWLYKKIDASEKSLLRNIKFQRLQLISKQQQKVVILTLLKILFWGANFLLFFTYVGFLFTIFPRTQKYGDIVFSSFNSAIGSVFSAFTDYLPNLFIIGLTIFLVRYIIRFNDIFFRAIRDKKINIPGFYEEWAEPTAKITGLLIYAIALAIVFPYLPGADSPAFRGVSVFIGALVTFGGASAISNVIGGVIVIYTRAYQIGDLVKVGDVVGNVLEKTILSTRIRTPNNQIVTIPNSTIVSSNIVNYTATNRELKEPLIVYTTITLGYDIPWRKVHQVLIDAALATSNISQDFKPFVLQTGLNDFYVSYELKAYSQLGLAPSKVPILYSELHQNIQDKCNEADIEILSPHYRAVRDGSHNTIPSEYLPDDYQAPGFKIEH